MSTIDAIYTALQGLASASRSVSFGDRQVAFSPSGLAVGADGSMSRIVLTVGDEAGKAGKFVAARKPGRNPRPFVDWMALVAVYAWVYLPGSPTDDQAHVTASTALLNAVVAAINSAAITDLSFADAESAWTKKDVERAAGKTLKVTFLVRVPMVDTTYPDAPTDADPAAFGGTSGLTLENGPDANGDPIPDTDEWVSTITMEVPSVST